MSATVRSAFVSAVAWIWIAVSAFATLVALLQNMMIGMMLPPEMETAMESATQSAAVPALMGFLLRNMRLFLAGFLVLCVVTLAASIGLLMRQNWARLVFILVMALGIAWNIACVVFTFWFVSAIPGMDATGILSIMMIGFNVLICGGFAVLFGWIIARLVSPAIRAEFVPPV